MSEIYFKILQDSKDMYGGSNRLSSRAVFLNSGYYQKHLENCHNSPKPDSIPEQLNHNLWDINFKTF